MDTIKPGIQHRQEFLAPFPDHRFHGTIRHLEVAGILSHHGLPERLGARCVEHPEAFGDRDLVLWSFVRVSPFLVGRRTHQEPTRRDPAEALADGAEWNLRRSALLLGRAFRGRLRGVPLDRELRPEPILVPTDGRSPPWERRRAEHDLLDVRTHAHRRQRRERHGVHSGRVEIDPARSARSVAVSGVLRTHSACAPPLAPLPVALSDLPVPES